MKQSSLLRHLDIDARSLGIGVSHHILDRLDVHTLLDHQCPERMPQRMGRDLRIADADACQPALRNFACHPTISENRESIKTATGNSAQAYIRLEVIELAEASVLDPGSPSAGLPANRASNLRSLSRDVRETDRPYSYESRSIG